MKTRYLILGTALCSLTGRPASHKREQEKPEAGLFEFFGHFLLF